MDTLKDYNSRVLKAKYTIPAWEEGANAFSKGLSLKDNPYDTKSANYISWKTAFKEAKKSHKRTFVK